MSPWLRFMVRRRRARSAAAEAIEPAAARAQSAAVQREAARSAPEAVQRANAAAHAAQGCQPGDPCPICRRPLPAGLSRAHASRRGRRPSAAGPAEHDAEEAAAMLQRARPTSTAQPTELDDKIQQAQRLLAALDELASLALALCLVELAGYRRRSARCPLPRRRLRILRRELARCPRPPGTNPPTGSSDQPRLVDCRDHGPGLGCHRRGSRQHSPLARRQRAGRDARSPRRAPGKPTITAFIMLATVPRRTCAARILDLVVDLH